MSMVVSREKREKGYCAPCGDTGCATKWFANVALVIELVKALGRVVEDHPSLPGSVLLGLPEAPNSAALILQIQSHSRL